MNRSYIKPFVYITTQDSGWETAVYEALRDLVIIRSLRINDDNFRDLDALLETLLSDDRTYFFLLDRDDYSNLYDLVATIKKLQDYGRIAVGYSKTNWRETSEVYRAGAEIFLEKSSDPGTSRPGLIRFIQNFLLEQGQRITQNRPQKILFVDDKPMDIDTLLRKLRRLGYQVDVVNNWEEGLRALERHWWHLAVVDRLLPDEEHNGMHLIEKSDIVIKKAMFTIAPTLESQAHALTASSEEKGQLVLRYWKKTDPDDQIVNEICELVENAIGINWLLRPDFDGPMTFSCMAEWLRRQDQVKNKRIAPECSNQELADELADLWAMIFKQPTTDIRIYSGPQGNGHTLLNRVKKYEGEEDKGLIMVKTGLREEIFDESERYRKYIGDDDGVNSFSTQKGKLVQTLHFGAITYSFVGGFLAETERFSDFYRAETEANIKKAINHLFTEVYNSWFTGRAMKSQGRLDEFYREQVLKLHIPRKRQRLEKKLNELSRQANVLGFEIREIGNGHEFVFTEDLKLNTSTFLQWIDDTPKMMRDPNALDEYPICVTHGDLNGGNILVNQLNQTWLIDFAKTGEGYRMRDFAELESVIALDLCRQNDLQALITFERVIFEQEFWKDGMQYNDGLISSAGLSPDLIKSLKVLNELRRLAGLRNRNESNLTRYYIALLFEAIFRLVKGEHDSPAQPSPLWQQLHALVRIATIIERLKR